MAGSKITTITASGTVRRVAVVGGGLAGLMTVIKLCEAGVPVDLFSLVPVKRSHSVCAQGGINASVNTKGEGDSPQVHFQETVLGGDFLAQQPPCLGMAEAAPHIVYLLDRMGVPFNRTPEGLLDFRRFGGTLYHRTAFAGATTGQQLLYALDEQVRRYETMEVERPDGTHIAGEPLVRKFEFWDFVRLVLDEQGVTRGLVCQDLKSMEIRAFPAEAVCLATGGPGIIFGRSTQSTICTGIANAIAYQQGAIYGNGEFIQIHPTAIPGADKLRLISESARGEGGRVWVPRDPMDKRNPVDIPEKERRFFLEEKYPLYKNLVPRDVASRELFDICYNQNAGIMGRNEVYLDLTHIPEATLRKKLAGILEIYEKFVGVDPYHNPMKVFPAVHYSMGGMWVDFDRDERGSLKMGSPKNHSTNIPGLYNVGESDYQYHGGNRLGANSLLSTIYGGMVTGPAMATYFENVDKSAFDLGKSTFDKAQKAEEKRYADLAKLDGKENPYALHKELGEMMLKDCTIERHNPVLDKVIEKIGEFEERYKNVKAVDTGAKANQALPFIRHLEGMLVLARVIAEGARNRDECRGAHYKPDFDDKNPKASNPLGRDDKNWLRSTLARYGGRDGAQSKVEFIREFDYSLLGKTEHVTDAVDTSLMELRKRDYTKKKAAFAQDPPKDAPKDKPAEQA
ncbi:MAG: succinate dehydrogenase flavoprotein subunit [Myxococcales bacterium]|nr:succinate dehydrogenase flavoprotein subunit [Myxococcales bacterium]